jgi:hypothetical protein
MTKGRVEFPFRFATADDEQQVPSTKLRSGRDDTSVWGVTGCFYSFSCTFQQKCHPDRSVAQWRDLQFVPLPDGAAVYWSHWLAGLAGKCFLEFGEIAHHSVGAELFR